MVLAQGACRHVSPSNSVLNFVLKNLAIWSASFYILNWTLAIALIPKPVVLPDQVFYYAVRNVFLSMPRSTNRFTPPGRPRSYVPHFAYGYVRWTPRSVDNLPDHPNVLNVDVGLVSANIYVSIRYLRRILSLNIRCIGIYVASTGIRLSTIAVGKIS